MDILGTKELRLKGRRSMVVNASLLKRLLAFVFDLLVVNLVVAIPLRGLLERTVPMDSLSTTFSYLTQANQRAGLLMAVAAATSLLTVVYFVWLERKIGQTAGKILFNLYVIPVDEKTSVWNYFLRSAYLIPWLPFRLLWVIDIVYLFFSQENQRLTEFLSRTKVIEKISW